MKLTLAILVAALVASPAFAKPHKLTDIAVLQLETQTMDLEAEDRLGNFEIQVVADTEDKLGNFEIQVIKTRRLGNFEIQD